MMKDVWISMNTIHGYDEPDAESVEFSTDGLYFFEDGVGCMSYQESEVTGLEGTRTSVMVMPDQVVVDRDGLITSRMLFREGLKNSFLYNTPYGQATMGIYTKQIKREMGEAGGSVEIDYVVDMEHAVVSRNRFQITVTEQPQAAPAN